MLIKTDKKGKNKEITPQDALIEYYIECAFDNIVDDYSIENYGKTLDILIKNKNKLDFTEEFDSIYEKSANYVENTLETIELKEDINSLFNKIKKSKIKNWDIILTHLNYTNFKIPIIEITTPYICPYTSNPIIITIEKNEKTNDYIAYSDNLGQELIVISYNTGFKLLNPSKKDKNKLVPNEYIENKKENLLKLDEYKMLKEMVNTVSYNFKYTDFNPKNIINMCNFIITMITLVMEYIIKDETEKTDEK